MGLQEEQSLQCGADSEFRDSNSQKLLLLYDIYGHLFLNKNFWKILELFIYLFIYDDLIIFLN